MSSEQRARTGSDLFSPRGGGDQGWRRGTLKPADRDEIAYRRLEAEQTTAELALEYGVPAHTIRTIAPRERP